MSSRVEDAESLPGIVDAEACGRGGQDLGDYFFVGDVQAELGFPDIYTNLDAGGLFRVDAVFKSVFDEGDEEEGGKGFSFGLAGDGEVEVEGVFEAGLLSLCSR